MSVYHEYNFCELILILSDPPQETTIHSNMTMHAMINEKLTLSCITEANPPPTYNWIQQINAQAVKRGNSEKLELPNLAFEDAGDYICQARNSVSKNGRFSESKPVTLKIYGAPHLYVEPMKTFETLIGSNISLEVMLCGEPRPNITWSRGIIGSDKSLSLDAGSWHERLYAESLVPISSHVSCYASRLKIHVAKSSDSDQYHITMKNVYGKEELTVYLLVHGKYD